MSFWKTAGAVVVAMAIAKTCLGQAPRVAAVVVADAVLWIDYCEVRQVLREGQEHVLGVRFTPTLLALTNLGEVVVNTFTPRKYRLWVNVATIAFHIPYFFARRHSIGLRFTP